MAEQMSGIPDDAVWLARNIDEDGYRNEGLNCFNFSFHLLYYLPDSKTYNEALVEDKNFFENAEVSAADRYEILNPHQVSADDAAEFLSYTLRLGQAFDIEPGYIVNDSELAAPIIESLKGQIPDNRDTIDWIYALGSVEIGDIAERDDFDFSGDDYFSLSTYTLFYREESGDFFFKVQELNSLIDSESEYIERLTDEQALDAIDDSRFTLAYHAARDSDSPVHEIIENLRRKVENERSDAERKGNIMPEQTKRDIRIKDPDAPASGAQMGLLNALAENGVVTPEELAALGDSPTKQAASDLISAHSQEEGFKAVQEARRAERAEAKPQREHAPKEQAAGKNAYVHVKMPAAFLKPHTYTAKDGRAFEKAYVHFPPDTRINGIDLSGYSCDVFLNDYMKNQMLAGEQVTVSFKADGKVAVWTGRRDDPQHPYDRKEVNPYLLASAIKTANEGFREAKAAERAAVKQESREEKAAGVTMKGMAEESRTSASALEGHDQPDSPATAR